MRKRKLGSSNLEVSVLGLGCMRMCANYGPPGNRLLAQNPWIVPIPGTTKLHHLEENIGAAAVALTPDDLRDIEAALAEVTVQGARHPEHLQRLVGR
jgi:aryl-alcohol dehydrogenase-like predicted oxidoreductase